MQIKNIFSISSVLFLLVFCNMCLSLRCRTDGGPTEEDIKKIVRICMHKLGENESVDDYSDEDSDYSEQANGRTSKDRSNNGQNFNRNYNQNSNMQRNPFASNNNNNNNNNNNWNNHGNYGANNNQGAYNIGQFGGQNQYPYSNYNANSNGNTTNRTNNQTEQDRACMVHCFFHELKMTNNEDFPEKRKILQILTKDIREQAVREFYVDSIQECFHMVDTEYNHKKNKCDVALTIVTCLTERAKTNCEDFNNEMVLF